jgi:hypothetical protein
MQPSSDTPETGGRALRRYGPAIAIVAVIAVIAAVVALSGGDDSADKVVGGSSPSSSGGGVDEAISFSEAKAKDLDVTFKDTCDEETGQVAMPFFFTPECFANVDDNGGATAPGVTADKIVVVAYVPPDSDPVLDYITSAINNDDTSAESAATVQGYVDMFNRLFQTYGRTVELKILNGSGASENEVAARADAVKAVEEMGAFAVIGGPVLANAWTDEIASRQVLCVGCPGGGEDFLQEHAPYVYSTTMSSQQTNLHAAEYVSKKLLGKPAEFAGDALKGDERKFAHLYIRSSDDSDKNAKFFKDRLSDGGVELTEQLSYVLDPGRLPEQATNIIGKLKSQGVTTVLLQADPIAPANFTQEATSQDYFPEWVIAGGALVDTTAFGRVYDQKQWVHAFGISQISARIAPEKSIPFFLYDWFHGKPPPAPSTAPVLFGTPALLFAGIQLAGPNLTAESFQQGLFGAEPGEPALTQPLVTFGDQGFWDYTDADYSGIDDMTEVWWDPNATGLDEISKQGTGMIKWVAGGQRYLPGDWTSDLDVFDPDGAIDIYDAPPASETPKDYPSPG